MTKTETWKLGGGEGGRVTLRATFLHIYKEGLQRRKYAWLINREKDAQHQSQFNKCKLKLKEAGARLL